MTFTYSRMVAFIMSKLPGMTAEYLQWKCDYLQVKLWFERAIEIHTGEYEDEPGEGDTSDVDENLIYKDGRWQRCQQTPEK